MDKPLFFFRGIEMTFDKVNILNNVDLAIFPSQCILITGDNGSGKTTLLKILAGLEKPKKAEIEFSGKSYYWHKIMPKIDNKTIEFLDS